MIHHTPLHEHEIYPTNDEAFDNRVMVKQGNCVYYFDRLEQQDYRIAQIISTNPNDYMQYDYLNML